MIWTIKTGAASQIAVPCVFIWVPIGFRSSYVVLGVPLISGSAGGVAPWMSESCCLTRSRPDITDR